MADPAIGSVGVDNGGAGSIIEPAAGGLIYSDGTILSCTAAGTSGQYLQSNGASAPTFVTVVPGAGINQLTGDVTAGPGSGSVAATIANSAVTTAKINNAAVDLTTKVTGLLPLANGGTNNSLTAANGAIPYSDASKIALLAPGTSGQFLRSGGAGAPTWLTMATAQTPTQNQYYYVAGNNGSDVTGDGTYNNPFATIAHAMGLITTAGANNRFIIKIISSKLQEPTNIALKPYVYIVGDHQDASYIRINGGSGSVVPDISWSTVGGARTGIQNIYFGGGTSIDWDLFSTGPNVGTPSCNFEMVGVTVTGNFTYNGRVPDIDFLQLYNCYIFGTTNFDALQNSATGTTFQGLATFSAIQAGSNSQYIACPFLSGLTITASATFANQEQLNACAITGTLTLTDAASFITLTTDSSSYPKHANISTTGTPTITLLSDAYGTGYAPAVPGNWSTVPSTVQQALDLIAVHLNPV